MRQFLKHTFASLVGTILGISLLCVLGASSLVVLLIAAVASEEEPTIKDKSVLVFDLSQVISDTEPTVNLTQALSEEIPNNLPLRHVITAIDKAAQDDRIVALFLDASQGSNSTGYATLSEVRKALQRFRDSGKRVIAYDVDLAEKDYYLSSIADTVIINPMGTIELNGLSSQQVFFAGALEKFGVGVQIVRVGKFKAAVEPFIQDKLSPENRQQITNLLNDVWGQFLSEVGTSRNLNNAQLQAIANNQGILLPEEALNAKLIDRVAYYDEVANDLKELTESKESDRTFRKVSLQRYLDIPVKAVARDSENKIAVVYAEGEIVTGTGDFGQIGSDRLRRELRDLREDEDVKSVVLRINSPGGSATASELILRELNLLAEDKPVVVSMGNTAASGGYWIATGAQYIFAEANTVTGSIGVFGVLTNIAEISEKNGITWDSVKTNNFADLDAINRPKTPQEMALYQRLVNKIYNQFLDKVATARNLPKAKVSEIAQGRIWSGIDAKQVGLVDEIGGLENAIAKAAEIAQLGDDWEVQELLKESTWEDKIIRILSEQTQVESFVTPDPLTQEFQKFKDEVSVLQSLTDPRGIYALLPFDLRME
ncbi:MAG: signal peptide peptidase SppA [Jaaginema sp. PMC 1079.18]|nr:signal peptide peptidase SppA [Jaaginema sp. PMC 1080.18]MEC4853749.1 signal peptide peptidase SppA [Jaaginema sp. PMC 1079.18]MEC4865315.1 signal peptide peptidase SppA [Jaaginema sp. PMC 1078.18]